MLKFFISIIVTLLILVSCNSVKKTAVTTIMGITKPKIISVSDINGNFTSLSNENNKSLFFDSIKNLVKVQNEYIKGIPDIIVFDNNLIRYKYVSDTVNCNYVADKLLNDIKFNKDLTDFEKVDDSSFANVLNNISLTTEREIKFSYDKTKKYHILICWTSYAGALNKNYLKDKLPKISAIPQADYFFLNLDMRTDWNVTISELK